MIDPDACHELDTMEAASIPRGSFQRHRGSFVWRWVCRCGSHGEWTTVHHGALEGYYRHLNRVDAQRSAFEVGDRVP